MHRDGLTLLDVGCGDGGFLQWASAKGCDVYGADIDQGAVATARLRVGEARVSVASAEQCAAEHMGRRYDLISLFDVLEHLVDPVSVLRGLRQRLAPSGAVLCTVPSHERWPRWFAPGVDSPPHHLTLWSTAALQRAAERAGLALSAHRAALLPDHLVDQVASRFRALQSSRLVPRALLAALSLGVAPAACATLRLVRPDAGGFALFGVARALAR